MFCDAILHDDRNSLYTIARLVNGRWREVSVRAKKVLSSLSINNAACFMTHNGFKGLHREASNTRQLNALFFDLDCHDAKPEEQRSIVEQTLQRIYNLVENGVLPDPTLAIDSGRGIHLLYALERSVPYYTKSGNVLALNEKCIKLFDDAQNNIADILDEALADVNGVEIDRAVFDHARVSRIPGTYNPKAGRYAEIVYSSGIYHSLSNLITYKPRAKRKKPLLKKRAQIINWDRLAISRVNKIEELQEYRAFKCEGRREIMCFLYYNSLVQIYGKREAATRLNAFNAKFSHPLEDDEITHILNEFAARAKNEEASDFYAFKAQTIADFLGLSTEEIIALNFFESKKQTERRLAKAKTRAKRDERNQRICKLRNTTEMTQQQIANEVGCSRTTVALVLKAAGLTGTKDKHEETPTVTAVRGSLRSLNKTRKQNLVAAAQRAAGMFKNLPYVSGSAPAPSSLPRSFFNAVDFASDISVQEIREFVLPLDEASLSFVDSA